ncbi:MAG: Carbamoyltransferase HypF [Syntrophaceae bacterium PtaU1.Bin231]|nr:MAG: Carbamoyltransferase HypF [Syntrophaceae bacterium PtaU1.Bin231]
MKRVRHVFRGVVQGVGFRPFIFVRNRPEGVEVETEGAAPSIRAFLDAVLQEIPPLAEITDYASEEVPLRGEGLFRIVESDIRGHGDVHIPPDMSVCRDCLEELFDPGDRRYRYPFINCTNCGPRLTIIQGVPYDRINTSMSCFPMCPACAAEYEDPRDRRFHAEPNACPRCGPRVRLLDRGGRDIGADDPVRTAVDLLAAGHVLAVKGLGGFHLSVDAASGGAVRKLRSRKFREEKPLAIMVRDIETAARIAGIGPEEEELLRSPRRPIVLAEKRPGGLIAAEVAPGLSNFGIMLPYTPLHHLLLEDQFQALVMTSANQVDEPICIGNREAVERLEGIADYFLVHNRDILVRCDDSIAMVSGGKSRVMRRSRGFAPKPIPLNKSYPEVLALGPQLKGTVCILKGKFAFLSPHIGDLETPQARDFFHETISLLKRITESSPVLIACDEHPGYYATKVAASMEAEGPCELVRVQHHHAHIVGCMAENGISGEVIGLAMDGTGYGSDGHAWGGEFLTATATGFRRAAHIRYFVLPGGERAVREPWRIAVSLLKNAYGEAWPGIASRLNLVPEERYYEILDRVIDERINSPLSSGLGRIFDGVAAILGLRRTVSFEGQAAMELEGSARGRAGDPFPLEMSIAPDGCRILDVSPAVRAIAEGVFQGREKGELAASFHVTLQQAFRRMSEEIRSQTGLNRAVLSGGCFQNRILQEGCMQELARAGFDVFSHRLVPPNDGGISLGQAVIAGSRKMTS